MSTFSDRLKANPKKETQKVVFAVCFFIFFLITAFVMHFVVMYKGWGLAVQSWGWLIFLWIIALLVGAIKHTAMTAIKKVSEDD